MPDGHYLSTTRRVLARMLDQGAGISSDNCIGPSMLGLWYDPERLMIEGVYQDELTAYRARRRWIEAMEKNFLLDDSVDFRLKVRCSRGGRNFRVRCDFLTACGRYAFWRITHHQAPEVQFLLETAHLAHTIPCRFLRDVGGQEEDYFMEADSKQLTGVVRPAHHSKSVLQRVVITMSELARKFSSLARRSSEV